MMLAEYLVGIIVILVVYMLWNSTSRPKNFPPGPSSFPVVGALPYLDSKTPYKSLAKLSRKYGKIIGMRQGSMNVVYVNDFQIAKEIFNDSRYQGRPSLHSFEIISNGPLSGVVFGSGRAWKEQRRFTLRHLRDFGFGKTSLETVIIDSVKDIIEEFKSHQGKPFNITVALNVAVLNITWSMVAGKKLDKKNPHHLELLKQLDETVTSVGGLLSDFIPWIKCLPDALIGASKLKTSSEKLYQLFDTEVKDHKKSLDVDNPRDLIDVYLKQIKEDEEAGKVDSTFNNHTLKCVIDDMFAAGSDTTSTALRFAVAYLITYPDIQKQLRQDIHRVLGKNTMVTLSDKIRLPRVEAFIMETLRMSSFVPFSVPHATTETTTLQNYTIPKGTTVNIMIHAIHRDERYWPDPEKFDMNRFLDNDGNALQKKDGFLPFSIGKRQCLGETLARGELFLFLTSFLQTFTFSTPPGSSPPDLSKAAGAFLIHPEEYTVVATIN